MPVKSFKKWPFACSMLCTFLYYIEIMVAITGILHHVSPLSYSPLWAIGGSIVYMGLLVYPFARCANIYQQELNGNVPEYAAVLAVVSFLQSGIHYLIVFFIVHIGLQSLASLLQ